LLFDGPADAADDDRFHSGDAPPRHAELLQHLSAERRQVVGLAARDEAVINDDQLVPRHRDYDSLGGLG
jgi:hypothetical protein